MELDNKQKVLLAIYTEYQKDLPDMSSNIRHDVLGIEKPVFEIALDKLENEGLINGVNFSRAGNKIYVAFTNNVKMTPYGIHYIEHKLEIEPTNTGNEKVKNIVKNVASWGWEQFKDIAAKTLAEIAKQ